MKTKSCFALAALLSTAAFVNVANAHEGSNASGNAILQKYCTKCHAAPKPMSYSEEQWEEHVERMAPRAGITDEEEDVLEDLNHKHD